MASTTPRTKTPTGTATKRGPRRAPVAVPAAVPAGPDLEAMRAKLYAAILEEHPGADLELVGQAFDLAVNAHEGQKRATGRAVRHPPHRLGADPRRARHRPGRDPGARCSTTSRRTPSTA